MYARIYGVWVGVGVICGLVRLLVLGCISVCLCAARDVAHFCIFKGRDMSDDRNERKKDQLTKLANSLSRSFSLIFIDVTMYILTQVTLNTYAHLISQFSYHFKK